VTVACRTAYIATVSLHDAEGTVPVTERFAATPLDGPDEIVDRVADELNHLRRRYGALPLTVVQDGAPELWGLVAQQCVRHGLAPSCELCKLVIYDEPSARELAIRGAIPARGARR
jgi:hypothetical protein